jgi:hypothetical protein
MKTPHTNAPTKVIKRLHCSVCGRAVEHSAAELLDFTQAGWPKCCNEVMELLPVTEEVPSLPVPPTGGDHP